MTLFPRWADTLEGAQIFNFPTAEVSNTRDVIEEWAAGVILNWEAAPTITQLPTWAQAKKFGTFEDFAAAIMDPENTTYAISAT